MKTASEWYSQLFFCLVSQWFLCNKEISIFSSLSHHETQRRKARRKQKSIYIHILNRYSLKAKFTNKTSNLYNAAQLESVIFDRITLIPGKLAPNTTYFRSFYHRQLRKEEEEKLDAKQKGYYTILFQTDNPYQYQYDSSIHRSRDEWLSSPYTKLQKQIKK